jgi:hypothetical protein
MADSDKNDRYLIGVDFGGTKILAGVFTPSVELVGTQKISTKADRSTGEVIDRIARCAREAMDECDLDFKKALAVGIGAPGAVDPQNGLVINGPNLGWEKVPLKEELEKRLGVPVFLDNDCNVCTLGVQEVELGSKPQHLVGGCLIASHHPNRTNEAGRLSPAARQAFETSVRRIQNKISEGLPAHTVASRMVADRTRRTCRLEMPPNRVRPVWSRSTPFNGAAIGNPGFSRLNS